MRIQKTNLQVNIESATNVSFINQIVTADLFQPSASDLWQNYNDTNSDNSSDPEINMAEYLRELVDEPSNQHQPRSASFSEHHRVMDSVASGVEDLNIQNASQVVYAYSTAVYSESVQSSFQTNANIMQETQPPFISSSSYMPLQSTQHYADPQQQSVATHIPIETQTADIYPNFVLDNHTSIASSVSTVSTSSVAVQELSCTYTVPQQEPTQLDLDSICCSINCSCCSSYPAVDSFSASNQVHNAVMACNEPQNPYQYHQSMPVDYPRLNNLNSPPMSNPVDIVGGYKKSRHHSMSASNIPYADQLNKLKLSKSVPNMSTSCPAMKRPLSSLKNKKKPRDKPPTQKQKRERLENEKYDLERSNEDLRCKALYLETEISKIRDMARRNGWIVPDFNEYD